MSGRILMATVAALALAAPVAAQDQAKPQGTEQEAAPQLQQTEETLQQESGAPTEAEQPPALAEEPAAAPPDAEVAAEEEAAPPPDMTFLEVQEEAQFLAEDEVIGKEVVNVQDEQVGTIADLVMDQEQKLVGIVLSVGGFLGIGDKWVAIPVEEIEFPTRDQPARLLVAVSEEQLTNAPDFVTRATVEAEQAAAQAQQQQMQQQQQIPPPTAGNQ
ncbi:MAG: PRC-barrel domain-containing protein [Geminicoccaceae bacterium]